VLFCAAVWDLQYAGSTARITPNMLITQNPNLMKRMNAVSSTFVRSQWYTALRLHPERDNITSVTDEKVHTDLRNKMSPGVRIACALPSTHSGKHTQTSH